MDMAMVDRWNAVVQEGESVLHLGDFALGPDYVKPLLFQALAGKITLVKGNHDLSHNKMCAHGAHASITAASFTLPDGRSVCCRHKPRAFSKQEGRAYDLLFHGHTHGAKIGPINEFVDQKLLDCSLEVFGTYAPMRVTDVLAHYARL